MPCSNQCFSWEGGGYSWVVKPQSAKFWPIFHFFGGGGAGGAGGKREERTASKIFGSFWHEKPNLPLASIVRHTLRVWRLKSPI